MKVAMVTGLIAIALVGLGIPSAAALDGPTPPEVADPVAAGTYNEIQVIFYEVDPLPADGIAAGAVSGNFALKFTVPGFVGSPFTTGNIAWDAQASAVDAAIEAAITGGSVSVIGNDGTVAGLAPFTVTFSGGGLGGIDIKTEVASESLLDEDSEAVEVIASGIQQGATTATDDVAPHGGYSSLTDYCLQCHQVHSSSSDPAGEYALMAETSVTSTCATCHGYLGDSPTGAEDPGFPGQEGTASLRAVYMAEPIHTIGSTSSRAESNWSYGAWGGFIPGTLPGPQGPSNTSTSTPPTRRATAGTASAYGGGFYCGSCHTPHGEFGQLINSKWAVTTANQAGGSTAVPAAVVKWQDNTRIYWNNPATPAEDWAMMYLFYNSAPPGTEGWMVCTGLNGAGPCSYAQTHDSEGQLVSLYGYKLLSYVPNHQYPVYVPGSGYRLADGSFSALPPGGEYADAPRSIGTLAQDAGQPTGSTVTTMTDAQVGNCPIYGSSPAAWTTGACPSLGTNSTLGTLDADITAAALSFTVTASTSTSSPLPASTLGAVAEPFKIRIDDEVMLVTARTPDGGAAGTIYTLTAQSAGSPATRATENPEAPWTAGTAASHLAGAIVYRIPTILVTETSAPPGRPFHIKFGGGSPTNTETAVVLARTRVGSTSNYVYTIGRAADASPQNESHLVGATILAQAGSSVATVKSWGVDIYDHDMATWCGTCHSGSVDVKFGGQYHAHPTGCTACHGNPADGSAADFPHSSTNEFLLKEVPDALCLECHAAGTLP